jgi:PAS domain S-box-containing protein
VDGAGRKRGSSEYDARFLRAQAEVAQVALSSLRPDVLWPRLLEAIGRTQGYSYGIFWHIPEGANHAVAQATFGAGAKLFFGYPQSLSEPGSFLAQAVRSGKAAFCNRFPESPFAGHPISRTMGVQALLILPIVHRTGRVMAALAFGDSNNPERFTERDLTQGGILTSQVAQAIENAELFGRVQALQLQHQVVTESLNDAVFTVDADGRLTFLNAAAEALTGHRLVELRGYPLAALLAPDDAERLREGLRQTLAGQAGPSRWEVALLHRGGARVLVELSMANLVTDGEITGCVGVARDITERKRAEDALRESEERFRRAFDDAAIGMALQSLDGRYLRVNRGLCEMLGYTEAEFLARTYPEVTHPEDSAADLAFDREMVAGARNAYQGEKRYLHRLGHVVWGLVTVSIIGDRDRQPVSFIVQVQDISARKQADEGRARLEGELRQAQKMEAIGRLAGGVAHDFNNLLTVILGRSQLLLERLADDDPTRRHIDLIQKTADRAAGLTRQLLAFSRKQVLQPELLDVNAIVANVQRMLRRLIGEHVELHTALEPGLGRVHADPGQLEQVILNLAVNARDAMPQGGRLTLTTANVETGDPIPIHPHGSAPPGRYVMLSVTDTGIGMDAETQAHLFEPFFTTKGPGAGTGLGLATVYGIVAQGGGYIGVASTPRAGSSFRIYLPRVEPPAAAAVRGPVVAEVPRGSETILLVEDEDGVRDLAREILQAHGYAVLETRHAADAIWLCEWHEGPIHLLVTDVVMPQMSGRDLVERLAGMRPQMKVLYMSGYTDDAIVHHGVLEEGTSFLPKPFTPETLAWKVRSVLDGGR